jgi:phosphate transport system substrate-binding protein
MGTNMRRDGRRIGGLMLVAALLLMEAATAAAADPLIVQGSTTFARRLMEPFKGAIEADAGHELTVIPNKSRPGLIALLEGRAHMAMISDALPTEVKALQQVMPGLPYGRLQVHDIQQTRIAVAVHPSNTTRRATLDQVRKIILGEITDWAQLGGAARPIRVVLVGGGGGVTSVVQAQLLDGKTVEGPHVIYVKTPVQLVQVVEQEQGAIGFAQEALARQRGLPELTTERPLEQTLSLITLGPPTDAMRAVIGAARRAAEKAM